LYSEPFSAEAKHMDTSHRLARETIRRILAKVLLSAEDALTQTDVAGAPLFVTTPESGASTGSAPFKVRWLISGSPICSVPAVPTLSVADVKELLLQRAGVPIEEQRLLHNGQELPMDGALPNPGSELLLMRSETDLCVSDLRYFHREVDFDPMPGGTFKRVRKLAEGDRTDLYRYTWQHPDGSLDEVVVRKVPSCFLQRPQSPALDERDLHKHSWLWAPSAEDRLTEIGVLKYLARQPDLSAHLLRMFSVFESDNSAWLVIEFGDGGDLFGVAIQGSIPEATVRRYAGQLLEAVAYLHKHHIGHRDVSLENVVLKNGNVKLIDFAMSVRSHSRFGVPIRFFRAVGKESTRAPEVYVPPAGEVKAVPLVAEWPASGIAMARTESGHLCEIRFPAEAKAGLPCMGEVWGYAARPVDIFAVGVSVFMLAWQCPPWKRAMLHDAHFAYVLRLGTAGLDGMLKHWRKTPLAPDPMRLITQMMEPNPRKRPSAAGCLASPWLAAAEGATGAA